MTATQPRRQLQQIIEGLGEGIILIDPDGRILWANESAAGMHEVGGQEALGKTVEAYRARFELRFRNRHMTDDENHPMLRAARGEEFADVVLEVSPAGGEPARTLRWRGLALTDADGERDCSAVVIKDETERYGAEERFERAFNANPAPAVISRLSDLRYVKVNQGFLEMTGYGREDIIGRSVYEIDVMERSERRELGIERLREGRTVPQMEAELTLPDGSSKFVVVAGQPIEIGEEPCMLWTFMDLEPRRKAETALRKSEERFAQLFRVAPVPTLLLGLPDFVLLDANEAFVAATGHAAAEAAGRTMAELGLWDAPAAAAGFRDAIASGASLRDFEMRLVTREGARLDCVLSAEIVSIADNDCVLCTLQDITDRKRSEAELIAAIEMVMQDASWFSRTVIEKLANLRTPVGRNRSPPELRHLSARERQVLDLMCQGLTDPEIAARLKLARNTVRNQVAAIYRKIEVHSRSAAIVWARERGVDGADGRRARAR